MPNWSGILEEIKNLTAQGRGDALDVTRRKYLKALSELTGRNVIAYYSGFLNISENVRDASITDMDKNGLMSVIHNLDRTKGLDLILHTPGGELAAAESLVEYLKEMFGNNIRAIIPQIAMSAGTMIACSCESIIMGKQSNIGPIDPQLRGIPATGVIKEFNRAIHEVAQDSKCIPIWQVIIGKYHPTFVGECEKAIQWSNKIVTDWLKENMLLKYDNREEKAKKIVEYLGNHDETKAHAQHIGLDIKPLETLIDGKDLQDVVLSIHHAYMITFSSSVAVKIIENQIDAAFMVQRGVQHQVSPQQLLQMQLPVQLHLPVQQK
ncbi:MAG: serine protease [Defluviitaleaceae bacterium]|nr:serine protease [Defluviitaleaceae bacterium]